MCGRGKRVASWGEPHRVKATRLKADMSRFYSRRPPAVTLAEVGRSGTTRVVETSPAPCLRSTRARESLGTGIQSIFASRLTCLSVWSPIDRIAEMTSSPAQHSLCCTSMLRKFGKTVRGKLDQIESRAGQPGPYSSSRHGGSEPPTPGDFPTQGDLFKFRKQRGVNLGASPTLPIRFDRLVSNCFQARGLCWRGGLQIVRFGKLIRRGKVISTSLVGHAPERFCMTIGEIGSLKVIGPG